MKSAEKEARRGRAYMRAQDICNELLPVHSATLIMWARDGRFPKPVKLNGTTVWSRAEVEAWIESQRKGAA